MPITLENNEPLPIDEIMDRIQQHLDAKKSGQVSVYVSISGQRRLLAEITRLRDILIEMNKAVREICGDEHGKKVDELMRDLGAN